MIVRLLAHAAREVARANSFATPPSTLAMVRRFTVVAALSIFALTPAIAQPRGDVEPVTPAEMTEIRQAFQSVGLREADVSRADDGRITLIGEYENRDAVEMAFAAARAVVGLRRVAPTTPSNIKYRLKGFEGAFASTVGKMMQRPAAAPKVEPPPQQQPPQQQPPQQQRPQPQSPSPRPSQQAAAGSGAAPTAVTGVQPPSPTVPAGPDRPLVAMRPAKTLALIIGVGKYKYLTDAQALEFADKDAKDFYDFLVSPQGAGLPRDGIRLMRHEEATSAAVKAAMREMLNQSQAGDTVVMFAASHGLPNAMNKFDIVLHDTEFPRKQAGQIEFAITNRKTALADDDLQEWIVQLTLRDVRTVLILDTCYSGKTFVAVPGYHPSRTRSLQRYQKEVEYSSSLSEEALKDLTQRARDARTTRIVIVSASEHEESMESPKSNGGLFTQTYIESLKKIHDYADAFDQAKPTVIRNARTVGHSQTPRLLAVPESAVTKM
jgi:hypothetical protein